MKAVYCPYCGGRTKRNGRTSSGSRRWRCTACGASTTVRYDDTATRLDEFIGWLLSKDSQAAMPGGGRSFRRRTAEFWEVWPMPVPDGELHRVLYVDGIWSRATSWCSYAAAARGWSPGTWPGPRTRGRGRPSWRRSRRPRWSSPTAGAGSPRPCARPGRAPGSRGAPSTPSRRSSATRRRGRSSRRGAGSTSSRATSWASRRCTAPLQGQAQKARTRGLSV